MSARAPGTGVVLVAALVAVASLSAPVAADRGPVPQGNPAAADRDTAQVEDEGAMNISLALATTRGDPLTRHPSDVFGRPIVAPGQPINATITYAGLGEGTHTIRIVDDEGWPLSATILATVTVPGDSGTAEVRLPAAALATAWEGEAGPIDVQARWLLDGSVEGQSDIHTVLGTETTIYLAELPASLPEGASTTAELYGWSDRETLSVSVREVDRDDPIATLRVRPDPGFEATYSFVPSEFARAGDRLRLRAHANGTDVASPVATIGIESGNTPPTADAGLNQTVVGGATVVLNASDSADPDNDTLGFVWTQVAGPRVELADVDTATPWFEAPRTNETLTLRFEVTVFDGTETDSDTVTVTVEPARGDGNDDVTPADPGSPTIE